MKLVRIGQLESLMPYVTEVKFSHGAVLFRGIYKDEILAENTPFCLLKTLSELDPKEFDQLMELTLPSGRKVFEVLAVIRSTKAADRGFLTLTQEEKLEHFKINEAHCQCKNYGGTSNYCHKLHEIIKTPCRCGFFEKK